MESAARATYHHNGQAVESSSALTRLTALHSAANALLEAEPAQAVALARDSVALAVACLSEVQQASSRLLLGKALLATAQLVEASESLSHAINGYASLGDDLGQAEAEVVAGKVQLNLGDLEVARQLLESAIGRTAGQANPAARSIQATALNHLAGVRHAMGLSETSLVALQSALAIWAELQNVSGQAHCLSNIGTIQVALGQYHLAIGSLNQAYSLHKTKLKDPRSEAFILGTLARVHHLEHDHVRAISVMQSARAAASLSQDRVLQATMLLNLGSFSLAAGHLDDAAEHLMGALELSREIGYRLGELSTLDSLGSLYERQGDLQRAMVAHQAALVIALDTGDTQGELEARLHLGQLHLSLSQPTYAEPELLRSLELAEQIGSPREAAEIHRALASLWEQRGDFQTAYRHQRELGAIERELFDSERHRQTRNLTIRFDVERAQHEAEVYRLRTEVEHRAREEAETLVRKRTAELARAQHEVVNRLAMAAEYRDDTTGEHTRRVGRFATRIARTLGWSEEQASVLGIAARLHDVGKIGIPDSVLLKADKLTSPEFAQMQTHTLIGARILSGGRSELLRLAEEIALTHHERWDGRGYPRGLVGQQIPLTGRIVAIADVFDALTQARPYKQAWSTEAAIAEIQRQSGAQFDPELVEVALNVLSTPEANQGQDGRSVATASAELPLTEGDATHVLAVFEQLLVERTRELDSARQETELAVHQLAEMAFSDSLTGLANRRSFEADLEGAFTEVGRGRIAAVSVVSFDLDGLKTVNDTQGHARGDDLLRNFAKHLAAKFAPVGRAYRIGGDEFAVIALGSTVQDLLCAFHRSALAQVQEAGFPSASASMGVARFPEDASTPGELLRVSDQRMYQHKVECRSGRAPPYIDQGNEGIHSQ